MRLLLHKQVLARILTLTQLPDKKKNESTFPIYITLLILSHLQTHLPVHAVEHNHN